jgi:type I restriction enzyme R subunit
LDPEVAREFLDLFWNRWHDALDAGHGACVLRQPDLATIVGNSLRHFDGERYLMLDFVVMPNHVHLLASFPTRRSCWPSANRGSTTRPRRSTAS